MAAQNTVTDGLGYKGFVGIVAPRSPVAAELLCPSLPRTHPEIPIISPDSQERTGPLEKVRLELARVQLDL
jgi:hypothetical protein